MTVPAWIPAPSQFGEPDSPVRLGDKAKLNGVDTPGVCQIIGAGSPRKWDKRDGYGWSGSWVVWAGNDLSSFSIVLSLYTQQDWLEWHAFKPIVLRKPYNVRPKALSIYHPVLAEVGIIAVVIEDVKAPQQTNDGEWTIELQCLEWRAPKFALAKPDGAAATEVDPVEQDIKLRREEFDSLAGEPP